MSSILLFDTTVFLLTVILTWRTRNSDQSGLTGLPRLHKLMVRDGKIVKTVIQSVGTYPGIAFRFFILHVRLVLENLFYSHLQI